MIASRLLALQPACQEIKIISLSHGLSSDIEESPSEKK